MSAPAVIGKFYRVPCVLLPQSRPFYGGMHFVPVIGPKHSDEELGVDWEHFHVDWRFVPLRSLLAASEFSAQCTPQGKVISSDHEDTFTHALSGKTVLKLRQCRRAMPDFPQSLGPKWAFMESQQRKRCDKLKDGHICPHRGIDLRPFVKPDGTAICPGHGLHWDLKTGLLLSRHGASTTEVTT